MAVCLDPEGPETYEQATENTFIMKSEVDKLISKFPYHQRELLYGLMGKIISLGIMIEHLYVMEFSRKDNPQKDFQDFSKELLEKMHISDSNALDRWILDNLELQIDAISYRLDEQGREESPSDKG